jgi:diguanylate cyclase (GGDEF)-like protein/PAS domain S-box-containing protein
MAAQEELNDLRARLARKEQELAKLEGDLQESRERVRRANELTRTAIIVLASGRITEANRAALRMLGVGDVEDVTDHDLLSFVADADRERTAEWIGDLRPGEERAQSLGVTVVGRDGSRSDLELLALGVEEQGGAVVQLLGYDVSERKHASEVLAFQSLHDPVTGLPNRVLFLDRARQALARTARAKGRVAILSCDIGRIRMVNDSLGHLAGDSLLSSAADRLRTVLRPSDTVARFGGDEFVVLCEIPESSGFVETIAQRMLATLSDPFVIDGKAITPEASVGVAVGLDRLTQPEHLLRDAAAALSKARELGRGRYEVFDESTRARAVSRLQIESALRDALAGRQLRVYYQPLVSTASSELVGIEALVRWMHPEHGFLLPDSFIPVAEDSALIVSLGNWVLAEACRQAAAWQPFVTGAKPLAVSVNVSAKQLRDGGFSEKLRRLVPDPGSGSPTKVRMRIEVTETTLLSNTDQTLQALREVNELGVEIAIDDFGTGYSSLAYLRRFPVATIKIGQSFVGGIDKDPGDRAIVSAVVQLAHDLGLSVVAEGVERSTQREALEHMGCDVLQGYLFGRPLTAERMTELLMETSGRLLAPARPNGAERTNA